MPLECDLECQLEALECISTRLEDLECNLECQLGALECVGVGGWVGG